MNDDAITLYKLVILYFLDTADFPITNAQLSDYLLNHEFQDYFTIQTALSCLEEDHMIIKDSKLRRSFMKITPEGQKILFLLREELSEMLRKDIQDYISANHYKLHTENSCSYNIAKNEDGSYNAILSLTEHNSTLLSLSIQVPSEEAALSFCEQWVEKNNELYELILKTLIS